MSNEQTTRGAAASALIAKTENRNLFVAIDNAFKRHPGGAEDVAKTLGCNPSTFRNSFNPENKDQVPSLAKFLPTLAHLRDQQVMNVLCYMAGGRFVKDGDVEPTEAEESLMSTLPVLGRWIAVISEILSDGQVSPNERRMIEPMLDELEEMIASVRASIAGNKKAAVGQRHQHALGNAR